VLIAASDGDRATELAQVRALIDRRVDGVVFGAHLEGSNSPHELLKRDVPMVLVSFSAGHDPRLGTVDIDECAAMHQVIAHLAALGHRRLAFARQALREEAVDRRPLAFARAVKARKLAEVGLDADPTAICCMNDVVAIDLLDRLERSRRRVPRDVSLVGFDDIALAAHRRIQLTTVRQDPAFMGARAAELVLGAVAAGRHVSHTEVVPTELVVRETTGPAPRGRA